MISLSNKQKHELSSVFHQFLSDWLGLACYNEILHLFSLPLLEKRVKHFVSRQTDIMQINPHCGFTLDSSPPRWPYSAVPIHSAPWWTVCSLSSCAWASQLQLTSSEAQASYLQRALDSPLTEALGTADLRFDSRTSLTVPLPSEHSANVSSWVMWSAWEHMTPLSVTSNSHALFLQWLWTLRLCWVKCSLT